MNITKRNNIVARGQGAQAMLFAHGFGCDQNMWRYVAPAFEEDYKVILFDYVGAGQSDLSTYDPKKYSQLEGYAEDIIEIIGSLQLKDIIFVGHSVSAVIGMIAYKKFPALFKSLIMIGPSPSYINEGDYTGGFSRSQVEELLEFLDNNHLGWSVAMAPVIMGNPERQELSDELANSFCSTDPAIANQFARATFLSDKRELLSSVNIPVLILQCTDDVIAPQVVGEYIHEQIKGSKLVIMEATGHCPNLSAPAETLAAIKQFLS